MKRIAFLLAVAVLILTPGTFAATAPATGPSLTILWEDGSGGGGQINIGSEDLAPFAVQNGPQINVHMNDAACQQLMEKFQLQDAVGFMDLGFTYDQDPFVTGGFTVYNPSGSTQTYTFIFTTPVAPPITPTSLYGGSMAGSITAGSSTPATVATVPNTPLYQGMIDGTTVLSIYTDPMSWTVSQPFGSGQIPGVNVPVTNVGPQVLNTISMKYTFTLTPDDITTMNGIFTVVPEPATLVLLGIGSLLLRKRRA